MTNFHLDFLQVKERSVEIARAMENEDGVTGAVKAFHKHFHLKKFMDEPESLSDHSRVFSMRRCFGCS